MDYRTTLTLEVVATSTVAGVSEVKARSEATCNACLPSQLLHCNPTLPKASTTCYRSPTPSHDGHLHNGECSLHLEDVETNIDDNTPMQQDMQFPAPCRISNFYLGITNATVDDYTQGIAIACMVDMKHDTCPFE